jgi:hypothetical protein
MTVYVLIIMWVFQTDGRMEMVEGFKSKEACEIAKESVFKDGTRAYNQRHSRAVCLEVK